MRPLAVCCGIGTVLAVVAAIATPGASAAALPNDDFAAAQEVGALPADLTGTTIEATVQPGEDDYFLDPKTGESVWYRWTAPADMRVWFDNCGAPSNTYVHVYEGSVLETLKRINTQIVAPGCEDGGIFGRREEFRAKAGAEYRLRVYSQLYEDGPFHLRLQRTIFDGSLTQAVSRRSIRKGQTVTYTVDVANLGTVPIDPWVTMVASKPGRLAIPALGTKYVSLQTSSGTCERVIYFSEHPGAACKLELQPGGKAHMTAKVRPSQSLTHWVDLDYNHGAGSRAIYDDVEANNEGEDTRLTTKVKPKRAKPHKKHRHHAPR